MSDEDVPRKGKRRRNVPESDESDDEKKLPRVLKNMQDSDDSDAEEVVYETEEIDDEDHYTEEEVEEVEEFEDESEDEFEDSEIEDSEIEDFDSEDSDAEGSSEEEIEDSSEDESKNKEPIKLIRCHRTGRYLHPDCFSAIEKKSDCPKSLKHHRNYYIVDSLEEIDDEIPEGGEKTWEGFNQDSGTGSFVSSETNPFRKSAPIFYDNRLSGKKRLETAISEMEKKYC